MIDLYNSFWNKLIDINLDKIKVNQLTQLKVIFHDGLMRIIIYRT